MHLIGQIPPHVQRMLDESNQLGQRLAALDAFTDTRHFKELEPFDQHLLHIQKDTMQAYLRVLLMRIERTQPKPASGLMNDAITNTRN